MKIKLCMLALAFALPAFHAQAQRLEGGVKVGADLYKINGTQFADGFTLGYHIGGFLRLGLLAGIGIQPEVHFSQVNLDTARLFSDIYQVSYSDVSKVKLGYLRIPILLDWRIAKIISLQAGPQFGILINDNLSLFQNGEDAIKKGDFSAVAGAQVNLARIRVYGRYAFGLNNINNQQGGKEWKNQTIHLGVGLVF